MLRVPFCFFFIPWSTIIALGGVFRILSLNVLGGFGEVFCFSISLIVRHFKAFRRLEVFPHHTDIDDRALLRLHILACGFLVMGHCELGLSMAWERTFRLSAGAECIAFPFVAFFLDGLVICFAIIPTEVVGISGSWRQLSDSTLGFTEVISSFTVITTKLTLYFATFL